MSRDQPLHFGYCTYLLGRSFLDACKCIEVYGIGCSDQVTTSRREHNLITYVITDQVLQKVETYIL